MRPALTAFAFGAAAVAIPAVVAALALGVAADAAGWGSFRVAFGPLLFLAFERTAATTATTLGSGILALAAAAGLLNAVGAALLRRRLG